MALSAVPRDVDHYPFEFLERVLWAMKKATSGAVSMVDTPSPRGQSEPRRTGVSNLYLVYRNVYANVE
jgi:hypothetical protein